jgi:hypothetical protein
MALYLHLGVVDQPYSAHVAEHQKRSVTRTLRGGKAKSFKASPSGGETTGDVAAILEEKYRLFEVFANEVGDVERAIEHSVEGSIETLLSGAPPSTDPFAEATGEIEDAFRIAIDQRIYDGLIPNVPTQAALKGVNHRLKDPYSKGSSNQGKQNFNRYWKNRLLSMGYNPERPSFKDTGLLQASFKAWVEETG